MSQHWSRLTALASLTAFAACAAPSQPAVDLAAEGQAVRAASMADLAAEQAKDFAKAASYCTPDCTIFEPHMDPLVGPAANQAAMERWAQQMPNSSVSWTTDNVTVAASGDMAVEVGSYVASDQGKEVDRGKYINTWRKLDGAWKLSTDMWVSTVPEQTDSLAAKKPAANQ